ncbi:S8 family serine peptidase [Nocardia noduli]|uniref:S8 family serine peptidase n=1 Tax=Nocardia noduli TaxID=2815722 RepID=UPI001C2136C6|nr:S8 family serine peptidase [Nocardia noduli]
MTRSAVDPEAEYSYIDKTTGRTLAFTSKRDEVLLTLQGHPTEATINEVVATAPLMSVSHGFDLKRGFAAVYLDPTQSVDAALRSLAEQPKVANAIPVMIDGNGSTRYFLPDEFTVQFRPEVPPGRAVEIIREHGSTIVVTQRTRGYYTLGVPAGRGLFATIREFSALDEVVFAEPSEVIFNALAYVPDDPHFGQLWGLHNTGQTVNGTVGRRDVDIDATAAWDVTTGSLSVVIAVLDTGADLNHRDLRENILPRGAEDWDFANAGDPAPQDEDPGSHGTHVCGTIAAVDNGRGVIGVASGCLLMPLRIRFDAGMVASAADAIDYVATEAAADSRRRYVMNCSWYLIGESIKVRTAIRNAVNSNVVVVCAVANDNLPTVAYPAAYPEVISVAALDQWNRKSGRSNYGRSVVVAAPGVNIWSTMRSDDAVANNYGFLSGASMAAAYVSGVAALVWSRNLDLTNRQVRQIVEITCDNVDADNTGHRGMLGRGRINANAAVRYVIPTPLSGTFTVQQRSTSRYLDAYEGSNDHQVVTRDAQNNDTQRWIITPVGDAYTVQQRSTSRYLDAYEGSNDHQVVTRDAQNNDTQRWIITPVGDAYTVQQRSTSRYLDAYEGSNDHQVVTRDAQNNDTQRWIITPVGDAYTVQQRSTSRYLDAYEGSNNHQVVTRDAQNNDTQRWIIRPI